ncbi:type IV toxin-antitoxin system AbiEi family antitoxin domain-containing protein [Murimonas intestini]|uniref:type IV toxin-antitoxin system AbiEi family antitoxin domain-containing protein n=1 Tax=Murimonas intestini TaxID=1337051 RepID=UPI0011DDAD0B|nr:type IV toxin-antitoxin system AbiEi family antitoxin domain-containing protein [Murimonas intestini]
MDEIWKEIEDIATENGGFIKTSQIEEIGISRQKIKKYVDEGALEVIKKGLYAVANDVPDEYVKIQMQSTKVIFSYGAALFLWDMSDRVPHQIDVTVPQGTNMTRIKNRNENLRFHYVTKDLYEVGITQTTSPQGGTVWLYDKERCICDLIRDKEKTEMQLYSQAIKEYFKGKPNYRKLLKYGKMFDIEDKIRTYMEVLT